MSSSAWTPVDETAAKWKPVEDAPTAQIKAAPETFSKAWWKEKLYNAADTVLEALPGVGATAGALVGGAGGTAAAPGPGTAAGAVGGAGIGGMAGEAAKQIGKRAVFGTGPATSGEAAKDITEQGVMQALVQGLTEGVGKFAPGALKSAAEVQYTKALKPTTGENKAIAQDIVPQMIDRGIHGSTEDMEAQAAKEIQTLKPRLNATYAQVPTQATATSVGTHIQAPVTTTLDSLESLKGKYVVDGKVMNPSAVNAIEGIQDVVSQHANTISPQSLRRVKQIFDESVSEAGGYTNNDLTTNYSLKAQKQAANSIRDILHQASPDAAALDKEMSFWLDVQQVTRASNLRRTGQEGGLARTLAPIGVGATAGAMGMSQGAEAGLGAAAVSALTTALVQATRSPAWRAGSAIAKDRLADALARNDVRASLLLLGRLGATVPASAILGLPPSRSTPATETPQ